VDLTVGSSLADLQRVIQLSLGWSDEYQHRFCIRNHYLGASRPGGLLFFGDPETMMLPQFAFRRSRGANEQQIAPRVADRINETAAEECGHRRDGEQDGAHDLGADGP
jgi:hypothetical protein